tara:strand:+ start:378 stop:659 length:282 start_codon:yes stop_codon:yes gene_type:complete
MNWFALPSDVGKVNPLIVTLPVPLPVSSRLAFDELVFTVLSSIVIPSKVNACTTVSVVKVPAAGVDAPMAVPSMFPALMSAFAIETCPVPVVT